MTLATILILGFTFLRTGPMTTTRWEHRATLLLDGRVLIAGGGATEDASAEVYENGTFVRISPMLAAHAGLAATRLADGRVLISGGGFKSDGRGSPFGDWGLRKCEIFDPATNTFAATGSLAAERMSHTATLLRDGRVFVAGGKTMNIGGFHVYESPIDTAEIYDNGTFTLIGKMLRR